MDPKEIKEVLRDFLFLFSQAKTGNQIAFSFLIY